MTPYVEFPYQNRAGRITRWYVENLTFLVLISLVLHVLRFLTVFPQLLLCLDTHLTRLPDLTSSARPPPIPTSHPISWPWPFPAQAQAVSSSCTFAASVPFGWNALSSLLQAHALCLQGRSNMASWGRALGHVQVAKDSPPGSQEMHVLSLDRSKEEPHILKIMNTLPFNISLVWIVGLNEKRAPLLGINPLEW